MNENLRDALDNMFDARVPNLWLKGSWESSTLGKHSSVYQTSETLVSWLSQFSIHVQKIVFKNSDTTQMINDWNFS